MSRTTALRDRTAPPLLNLPVVWFLAAYKRFVSPMLPPACRFEPTCSEYGRQCFERFAFPRALWLTVRRVGRCHPFTEGGWDPAPERDDSRAHPS